MRNLIPTHDRNDPLWAMLLCMFNNANVANRSDQLTPEDFMIYRDKFAAELTVEDLRASLRI